ncbi:dihydrolipoamide acetyltransferase family protein [Chloroflexota bacterium]
MAVPITIPKLGWGTAPTLVEWKTTEGEPVEKGSVVVTLDTQKVIWEIEADTSGLLHIISKAGDTAEIGTVVGFIAATEEELASIQRSEIAERREAEIPTDNVPEAAKSRESMIPENPKGTERIRISPVARKMAEEHMIDIVGITGTGPDGRIVREDIRKTIEAQEETGVSVASYQGKQVKSTIPLTGMRATIAEHMHHSLSSSAQITTMGEIDMTEVVKWRENLLTRERDIGARITYTDIFVLTTARLLSKHTMINSSLIENDIKLWDNINIGVAVALDDGLIVPVIKNADKKLLVEISRSVKDLAERAREGKLAPDDVSEGTFTITNLGARGGGYRFETVIINQPEAAILGTGGITERVVVRNGQMVICPIMTYYFTYDHRIINGAVAASFMADFAQSMAEPEPLFG